MFDATVRADILTDALAPVNALVSECKVRTTEDGLDIRAVDPGNVAMIDMEIDSAAFASYEADGGLLGLNLERLTEIIGMADSEEFVHLVLDDETRKLNIEMGGLSFTMALIDPDSIREEPDIPDLDLPGRFVFEGSELDRAVTAADLVSDHIEIGADDDALRFTAEGDTDDVEVTLGMDDLLSDRFNGAKESVASLFSLDYLDDMTGPIDKDAEVSMLLGDEFPVKLRYSSHDGDVSVLNMLAPRIQSD